MGRFDGGIDISDIESRVDQDTGKKGRFALEKTAAYEPDWRTAVHARVAKNDPPDPNPEFEPGSLVVVVNIGMAHRGGFASFPQPSASAMALNIASQAAERAMHLQPQISFDEVPKGFGEQRLVTVTADTLPILFDYFEQCMLASTFSFQALEAYCNIVIDSHVRDTYPWPDGRPERKGQMQAMTSGELEFYVSTKDKLKTLLPKLLDMKSPKDKVVWQAFKRLQRLRNDTVHINGANQTTRSEQGEIPETTLFMGFINATVTDWPKDAVNMINYFDRRSEQWPWLQHELDRHGIDRNAGG